jgi:peptidoglycan/xylan/chitin deacetylase (PgdA/CDA1 family)
MERRSFLKNALTGTAALGMSACVPGGLTRVFRQKASNNRAPALALGFDDGPSNVTPDILDILKQYDVRASFFVIGRKVEANADIIRRMVAEGHDVGNHTWSHPHLSEISLEEALKQMHDCDAVLEKVLGYKPSLGRPPFGSTRNDLDYPMIVWNLDPKDWRDRDPELVAQRILDDATPGALGILHDTHPATAQAVAIFLPKLLDMGYKVLSVTELFAYYGQTPQINRSYYHVDVT